jgi:hypothetical protein
MSTALAIASVTAVLRDLLNNGLIDHNIASTVGNVTVSALAPDRIDQIAPNNQQSQLNLFLYQVTPNAAWRNVGLPSRDARGERASNPPLALDLHYLLTAYGLHELHAEILLGYGMQLLHETPVLTRPAIRTALAPPTPVASGGNLPSQLQALFTSELAEQVEQIKICPETLNTEEISRMWTAFQAHYRPTAAYQVSVVLIESRRSRKSPLPVRDRRIYVVPFKQPLIVEVRSQATPADPILSGQPIVSGHNLVLIGRGLRGEHTRVAVGGVDAPVTDANVTDAQVIVAIPVDVRAGLQSVQVIHQRLMGEPPALHRGVESNLAAFVLRPRIVDPVIASNVQGVGSNPRSADVTVKLSPVVGNTQRVVLLLNKFNPVGSPPASPLQEAPGDSYSFIAPSRIPLSPPSVPVDVTDTITFAVTGVKPGVYLVRVQVDGADSPLTSVSGQFDGPLVTIP